MVDSKERHQKVLISIFYSKKDFRKKRKKNFFLEIYKTKKKFFLKISLPLFVHSKNEQKKEEKKFLERKN